MPRTALNSRRSRTSCSLLALATVLAVGATPAAAQSFLGTGTYVTNPHATGITTGAGTTTINLNAGNTVINWTPTENAVNPGVDITFQNAGTTATFTGAGDFAVLNRILPQDTSRVIAMHGTVNSLVGGAQRGSVYFYSPSGFVFGGSSVFNVGTLGITTLPITNAGFAALGNNGIGSVSFGSPVNPNSAIVMNGTVNASYAQLGFIQPPSSYVALVAPRVVHTGTINVNGSAAIVAAEAATINFTTDSLFDIQVTVGTTDENGIVASGNITGPTPTGINDRQGVYLVAVPKNDALTMVISNGADLGFTLANTAVDDNGVIVLSAGHDIVDGQIGSQSAGHGADAAANFWFTGAHATNNLIGEATGYADLYSTDAQASQMTTVFDNDVTVHADEHVLMNASGAGSTLTVAGNVSLSTDQFATEPDGSATGGDTTLSADTGGSLTVSGNAFLSANGSGGNTESSGATGGTGTGGQVLVEGSSGATLHIVGNLSATADGYGGGSFDGNGGAGIGGGVSNGGGVNLNANGGAVTVGGTLFASASGIGGEAFAAGTTSGQGTGGNVWMQAGSNGDLSIGGNSTVYAEGRGGTVWDNGANGGDGLGGVINLSAVGTGSTLSLAGGLFSANGEGGGPGEGSCCVAIGGDGIGGYTHVFGSGGGLIQSNGSVELSAAGSGGYGGTIGGNGTGGSGVNGGVFVHAQSGLTLNVTGDLALDATGSGGDGESAGGNGSGGSAQLQLAGGTVNVSGELNVDADGFGGDGVSGGNGGHGTGGVAEVVQSSGASTLTVGSRLLVEADGIGGSGDSFNEGPVGNGGNGNGGRAGVYGNGGSLVATADLEITADGTGGFGTVGGTGTGRNAEIFANNGSSINLTGDVFLSAIGTGGDGIIAGGDGFGGGDGDVFTDGVHIFARRASISISGLTTMDASGFGGAGGDSSETSGAGGSGGDGTGGWATVVAANDDLGGSSINLDDLSISADGNGGAGGAGGSGNLGGEGGDGGNAFGGKVEVFANAGNGMLDAGDVLASAIAVGGSGGSGGNGDGETGGNGGNGGDATGGHVAIGTASGADLATGDNLGVATYASISADASATGGDGGDGNFGTPNGIGGDGGDAQGGGAVLLVRGSVVNVGDVSLFADATGGNGGFAGGEGPLTGNGGSASVGGESGFLVGSNGIAVEVTDRFLHEDQFGTLNAGNITGSAVALGGLGAINGSSETFGGNVVNFRRADGTLGSLDFNIAASSIGAGAFDDEISIVNGDVTVTNAFSFVTDGNLSFYIDNGSLTAGSLTLSAPNFVANDSLGTPASTGTATATNLSVTSDGDFIADANINAVNGIDITVPGSIRFDNATSSSFVDLWAQGGSIDIGNVNAGSSVDLVADTFIDGGNITAGGSIFAQTFGGDIDLGSLTSTFGSIFLDADGNIDLAGDALADGDIELTATGAIDMNNATAGESVVLSADGNVLALNLTGGDSVDIDAGGSVNVGNISAGLVNPSTNEGAAFDATIVAGGNIVAGNISAAQDIGLATPGTMTAGDINAGGIFMALGHGDMVFGDATASEVFLADFADLGSGGGSANCVGECGTLGANGVVTAPPTGSTYSYVTTEGGVDGAGQIPGEGGTNGSLFTTSVFEADAGDDLNFWFNYVTSDGAGFADYAWAALFTSSLDPVAILFTARTQPEGTIVPGFDLPGVEATLNPASVPIIDGAPVWDPLGTSSGSCFAAGCGFTGWINSTYDIANAGNYVVGFGVSNFLDTGFQSGMAFSGITVGGISVTPSLTRTDGSITIGNVNTGLFTALAGTSLTTGIIDSSGPISLDAGGAITTGNLFAGDFVLANGGSITTGNIEAGSVDMTSLGGNITAGDILASGDVALDASLNVVAGDITSGDHLLVMSGGNQSLGDLSAGDVNIEAGGNVVLGNANAATEFDFDVGGNLTGGNIVAGVEISGEGAGGTVTLGNLTAGFDPGEFVDEDTFSIGFGAGGSITVGNVNGANRVGFATLGSLTTGSVQTGWDFITLVAGNISTGSITTGEGDQVYMAHASMYQQLTNNGELDLDPEALLALDPVSTGGSITINGPVSTGLFRAAAGTSLTTQAITADTIEASAVGTATLNGIWNADWATLTSNQIDITGTGGINAAETVRLVSTNSLQTLIGDGFTGSGYALSNAEFGRISGGQVEIFGRGDATAAIDMLIGDLTVTGPLAGSTIESGEGDLVFAVGDVASETIGGVIRVVGDVSATGFGAENAIEFHADRFELDAALGSLGITSSGSTLGGEIGLYADRIHIAAGSILDQLAANPTYTGYQQDLDEPATVQRPEGVLRADTLWIESDNLQDILIQNTGTAGTRAGFLVRQAFVNDDQEVAGPAGSINMVVNGQVVTEGGTLTGVAARDALVPEGTDITPFTSNSTINGCPLTGQCIIRPPEPPPTADVVDNQIDLITNNPLGDGEFGNEPDIDDGEEGDDGANNPIAPPQPLFDTRPLIPGSDVNDPVSGTGNPALLGSEQCEEDDQEGCPTKPVKGDSQ